MPDWPCYLLLLLLLFTTTVSVSVVLNGIPFLPVVTAFLSPPQPPTHTPLCIRVFFSFLTCTHTSSDHTSWSSCPVVHINARLCVGVNYSLIDVSSHRLPICPNYYFQCSDKCFHESVKMSSPCHSDLYRMFRLMYWSIFFLADNGCVDVSTAVGAAVASFVGGVLHTTLIGSDVAGAVFCRA